MCCMCASSCERTNNSKKESNKKYRYAGWPKQAIKQK